VPVVVVSVWPTCEVPETAGGVRMAGGSAPLAAATTADGADVASATPPFAVAVTDTSSV